MFACCDELGPPPRGDHPTDHDGDGRPCHGPDGPENAVSLDGGFVDDAVPFLFPFTEDDPPPVIDLGLAPGMRLAGQVQVAAGVPELLARTEVLDTVQAAAVLQCWLAGVRIRMLCEFADRHPAGSVSAPPGADPAAAVPSQRWVPDEVGLTLGISRLEAMGEIAQAQRFVHVLPDTLGLLEQGRIDLRRAEAVARATAVLPDDLARRVEALVLDRAAQATVRQLQDRLRRAVARVDPEGEFRRHRKANLERRVAVRSLEEGMASLWFYGSAAEIEAAWQMADRLARSLGPGDPRTLDQRRFDLAMQVLQGQVSVTDQADVQTEVDRILAGPEGTGAPADHESAGAGAAADVTAPDDAAAGLDAAGLDAAGLDAAGLDAAGLDAAGAGADAADAADQGAAAAADTDATDPDAADADPGAVESAAESTVGAVPVDPEALADALADALSGRPDLHAVVRRPLIQIVVGLDTLLGSDRPAELLGHGPVDATTARALAAGGVWERLVTDPLSGAVLDVGRTSYTPPAALDDHVRARDQICRGPQCSRRIRDLDHHHDWALGGPTCESNLFGLCRYHHTLKDAPGWQVIAHPDRSLTWISPCGRRYRSEPFDYRPYTDDLPGSDTTFPATATATATAETATAPSATARAATAATAGTAAALTAAASAGAAGRAAAPSDRIDDEPPF